MLRNAALGRLVGAEGRPLVSLCAVMVAAVITKEGELRGR